jgi:hypothetical protein
MTKVKAAFIRGLLVYGNSLVRGCRSTFIEILALFQIRKIQGFD